MGATGDFAIFHAHQEFEFDVFDEDIDKDDHLVGTVICVHDLMSRRSHVLNVHPRKKEPQNANACNSPRTEGKGWDVMSKVKSVTRLSSALHPKKDKAKAKEKVEEVSTLEVEVVRFDLVAFTESAMKKSRSGAGGPSEAVLGVSIYGLAPMGAQKTVEDTRNLRIRTTHRKKGQKAYDERVTPRGKIRDNNLVPDGVDRNVMKVIQNMTLDPDFSAEHIADVVEVDEDTVKKVLAMKKVMPLYFNDLDYFFVGSCDEDVVVIDIIAMPLRGEKSKDPVTISSMEMPVKDVVMADHVIPQSFIFTEVGKPNEDPQDYEVKLKFQVWALQEHR